MDQLIRINIQNNFTVESKLRYEVIEDKLLLFRNKSSDKIMPQSSHWNMSMNSMNNTIGSRTNNFM
jgi:hypothetical protein